MSEKLLAGHPEEGDKVSLREFHIKKGTCVPSNCIREGYISAFFL